MAAILDAMKRAGLAKELPVEISSEQIRQQFNQSTSRYPMANDTPTDHDHDAAGHLAGDASTEDTEEIYVDASLLDQHVRELIQAAGGSYDFKRAVESGRGRMVKIDDHLMDALERLEAVAPLLNKAVELAQHRGAMHSPLSKLLVKAGGSAKGSASGDVSGGSASGDASTQHHDHTPASIAGGYSGEVSTEGSASGSQSGELSKLTVKALFAQFRAGDRQAGIDLLRRKLR